ncbi:MAG TPA: TonB-dependent receptor [Caulobacteraceae bacterium]|jgi:outer membrane receptor protein involved in Fe transport
MSRWRRHIALSGFAALTALAGIAGGAWAQSQAGGGQTQAQPSPSDQKSDGKSTTVKGVTVTADKPAVRADIDRRSYDISKDLAAQNGASIADALRNVPSVDVDVDGKVTLRGAAGVTIMVDGKPSPMLAGPGVLLQVPADQYERVEVMTNPSAAFSPNGAAGIINLITKKHHPMGSFGFARVAVDNADRYRGGGSASIKNDKVTVVLYAGEGRDERTQPHAGDTEAFDSAGGLLTSTTDRDNALLRLRYQYADIVPTWDLDPKSQLTFRLSGYRHSNEAEDIGETTLTGPSGALIEDVNEKNLNDLSGEDVTGELKFRREFTGDEHDLTLALSVDRSANSSDRLLSEAFAFPAVPDAFQRSDNDDITRTIDFSGDYNRPLSGGAKLKAGWDINDETDLSVTSGFLDAATPTAPDDPGQSDHYHFRRLVSAGYLTYQQPFGKLTVMGGLRLEGENLYIDDVTTSTVVRADDVHLYPTIHLDYAIDDDQHLQASYSERIQRPDPSQFDPFLRVLGPFNQDTGNPHLKPQQTQDFETSWQDRIGGAFVLATAYYKSSTGGVTEVTTDVGAGVLLSTAENLTRSKNAGVELVLNGKLPHGFSYSLSSNAYWNQIDGVVLNDTVTRAQTTITARASINWQADPKDFLQITAYSPSRILMPQSIFESRGPIVNLGWRRKLTDKLSLVTTVGDVFDRGGSVNVYDTELLRGRGVTDYHNRSIYLGLNLTFGAAPKQQQEPAFDYSGGQH